MVIAIILAMMKNSLDDSTSTNPTTKYAVDQQSRSQRDHVSKEKARRLCTLVIFGHTYMHHMLTHSPQLTSGFLHIRVALHFPWDGWMDYRKYP